MAEESLTGSDNGARTLSARRHGVSVASKLAATMLVVGLVSLVAATLVGVNAGQRLGSAIVDTSLTSSGSSGAREIASQLDHYRRLAQQLAASPQTSVAIEEFADGLEQLNELTPAEVAETRQALLESYETRFFQPLREAGQVVQVRDILPGDPSAVYLQGEYSLPVPPVTDPATVDDSGDGSDWSATHAQFHPVYRTAARESGLRDVYLVDASSERIVYSSAKGPDLGTSLAVGPYSGTIVARAADAARASDGQAVVVDLGYYRGAPGGPIGAASALVGDAANPVGAVVLTYDAEVLTGRLTSLVEASVVAENEDEIGDDDGGDMYLIGSDGTTRSDPQSYLAAPTEYLDTASEAGVLSEDDRERIERAGTTILLQPAPDTAVNAARTADTEPASGTGVGGLPVAYAVQPVDDPDVSWSVVREVDSLEAEATVTAFRRILLTGTAVFMVALAFVAVAWTTWFTRPIRLISQALGRTARETVADSSPEPVVVPERSSIELHRLADSLTTMGESLTADQRAVRDARAERLAVLSRMLPESVAHRIARGDVEAFEQIPTASVAVVVVLGLGDLLSADPSRGRRTVDALHAEIDDIAAEHGLDRIKVVGDAYFAACGHDRPFLDHAPRAVAFAKDAADAVAATPSPGGATLRAATGVATGPVTVGMSGRDQLVYDVWGPTVTAGHALARSARPGEVLLTDSARDRLPPEVPVEPIQDTSRLPEEWAASAGVWTARLDEAVSAGTTKGATP